MGKVLAFDYGTQRVGVAQSDAHKQIALPMAVLSPDEVLNYVQSFAKKESISAFVVGLPYGLRLSPTDATQGALRFGAMLKKHFPHLPLHWVDERLTSKMAEDALLALYPRGKEKRRRLRRRGLDASSAALLLQSHLAQLKA